MQHEKAKNTRKESSNFSDREVDDKKNLPFKFI